MKLSASPMFGVVTVKRMSVCSPGVMPPSSTQQQLAGRPSTRTIQLFCVALASTVRSTEPVRSGTPDDRRGGRCSSGEVTGRSVDVEQAARRPMTTDSVMDVTRMGSPVERMESQVAFRRRNALPESAVRRHIRQEYTVCRPEASIGAKYTEELTVMMDSVRPPHPCFLN